MVYKFVNARGIKIGLSSQVAAQSSATTAHIPMISHTHATKTINVALEVDRLVSVAVILTTDDTPISLISTKRG